MAAIEDPDVRGVTVYVSDFKRSLTDKLSKNFFSEPSQVQQPRSHALRASPGLAPVRQGAGAGISDLRNNGPGHRGEP